MIHQPWGGAQGQATDIEIQAKEILRIKESVSSILAAHTGKPLDIVRRDTERDFFMSASEAVEYGIVDQVISKIGVVGETNPPGKNG
jgi:ATP-dependent Clp protease protease subunit